MWSRAGMAVPSVVAKAFRAVAGPRVAAPQFAWRPMPSAWRAARGALRGAHGGPRGFRMSTLVTRPRLASVACLNRVTPLVRSQLPGKNAGATVRKLSSAARGSSDMPVIAGLIGANVAVFCLWRVYVCPYCRCP